MQWITEKIRKYPVEKYQLSHRALWSEFSGIADKSKCVIKKNIFKKQ